MDVLVEDSLAGRSDTISGFLRIESTARHRQDRGGEDSSARRFAVPARTGAGSREGFFMTPALSPQLEPLLDGMSRRLFLRSVALAGGGFLLGYALPAPAATLT